MKSKICILTGLILLAGACDDSDYELENLVPQEYHKILYVNNGGKQEIVLFDTEDDFKYSFSVIKSGSNTNQTASATISLMSEADLFANYSEPEGKNYKIITEGSYTLQVNQLDFTTGDRYKLVEVALKPQNIKASLESDPAAQWVLPLQIVSEQDSVNAERNNLFLQITDVIMPGLGFVNMDTALKEYSYGQVAAINERVNIGLDIDNKWDLTWELAVDDEYITAYNSNNGTSFMTLPEGTYSIPATMELSNNSNTAQLSININGNQLKPGDYMLPVRIKNISLFVISPGKDIYPLRFRILGNQLDRTGWTGEATSEESSGEGPGNGVVVSALDGDPATYWHSRWSGWTDVLPHEIIIDTKNQYTFSQFAMAQRQNQGYLDTKAGEFYVSDDKENWAKVGNFTMERIFDAQTFGVTPTKGRYFKIKITHGYRDSYCSFSEIYAYGLKE